MDLKAEPGVDVRRMDLRPQISYFNSY